MDYNAVEKATKGIARELHNAVMAKTQAGTDTVAGRPWQNGVASFMGLDFLISDAETQIPCAATVYSIRTAVDTAAGDIGTMMLGEDPRLRVS